MLKKAISIILMALFICSCKVTIDDYEEVTPSYVGTWTVVLEDATYSTTYRRLVLTENSYQVFIDTTNKTTNTTSETEEERGELVSNETQKTFTFTTTHISENSQLVYVVATYQEKRDLNWDVSGKQLILEDSTTSKTIKNLNGTYIKK